jgi:hypothetical protein
LIFLNLEPCLHGRLELIFALVINKFRSLRKKNVINKTDANPIQATDGSKDSI